MTPLLSLLRLTSSSLPIGSFAYSQGLESAVELGWIQTADDAASWIAGLLHHTQLRQDVPLFVRLYRAWEANDLNQVVGWNARVMAMREAAELRAEERASGMALARLLGALDIPRARQAENHGFGYLAMFALASVKWGIDIEDAACGYLWTWSQNQVTAAVKIIPLGQTAGQRLLGDLAATIPAIVRAGFAISDDDIGCTAPGLAITSALHERQYTRLFLS